MNDNRKNVRLDLGSVFAASGPVPLLDVFYFSATMLTTVGYGDLAPSTAAGKPFTVFYIFAGIGIIVGFATP